MLERKQETKLVKEALAAAGYRDITAKHGTGTAWGWLHVGITADKPQECSCVVNHDDYGRIDTCQLCKDARHNANISATNLILEITGRRRGDYDGNTIVDIELIEAAPDQPTPKPADAPVEVEGINQVKEVMHEYQAKGLTFDDCLVGLKGFHRDRHPYCQGQMYDVPKIKADMIAAGFKTMREIWDSLAPEPVPYTTRETRRAIRMAKADRANMRITKRNGAPLYY